MASNFPQHMGNPMMQQQQRQQQRPQISGDPREAVHNMIQGAIQNPIQNPQQWHAQVLPNERLGIVTNILGGIRLTSATQPNPPTMIKMVEIAIRFERDILERSPDKGVYKREVEKKLEQLRQTREKQHAALQAAIQAQAQQQAQNQAQQAQQAQQMQMNQSQLQQAQMRNMGQQSFQHLQHQMQASPLPGQQPSMNIGMNDGLSGNMSVNPQQQLQMQMAAQQAPPAQPNMVNRPPGPPNMAPTPQENAWATEWANRNMANTAEDAKANIRAGLQERLSATQQQNLAANGIDLAFHWFRQQALGRVRNEKLKAAQGQLGPPQGTPMAPQRSMNPSPLNAGQAQAPQMQMPGGDAFMNVENIAAQQQQGMIAQHTGEVVVPVSAQRNATPQPGMAAQRTTQQQQQLLLAQQQQQQQRLQQQQQQNQARLSAQAKVQGLTGQPGGMSSGPMPLQPSPAMPTLNTPMRTPQQMNAPGPEQQGNPGAGGLGQQFDPRFSRQMNPNMSGLNMPNGNVPPGMLDLQRQQQIANLPQEKVNELITKWGEARVQEMLRQNGQGARPGMPMQGNASQPGQQMPFQMNPQTAALQQFMASNPGRPIPPALTQGLTPQQQAMLSQQQFGRGQGPNPNQAQLRNGQALNEQNMMRQMDNLDFPSQIFTHNQMPQNIPRELKKWGQLKIWVQQNQQNLGPGVLDNIRSLQKMHYQNIMRTKQQQQQQQQNGIAGGPQMNMPGAPNMAAPVAQIGQNPAQMPIGNGGQGILPPTQEEINTLRGHHKFAGASDDQIRAFLANRNAQMSQAQLQERNQHILQMRQSAQMQQRRPTGAQPNPAATPQMTAPQQKPAQTQADAAQSTTAPGRQPSRSQGTAQRAAQSSPAAQPNNLKRASSDDVVEVPNPNQARQAPQQPPVVNQQPQGGRAPPTLTPQQIASLRPDQREKYEAMMRARQQGGVPGVDLMKLRAINEEELKRPQEPLIPMDAATKADTAGRLRSLVHSLTNVTKAIPRWFQVMRDEPRLRSFFHTKNRIQAQFADNELKVLKEVFSITPQEVEQARAILGTIVKDLSDRFPQMMMKQDSNQSASMAPNAQATPQPGQITSAPAQAMPLNAANLQQQQQQLNKMHQRSGSHSSRPPAAPTSAQPPFQLGAPSPQGLPAYIGKNTVTQEKLHIPPRKKQKQNLGETGQTTPASNASPQVAKNLSPEVKRDPPQFRPQAKPALVCSEPECDRHNTGFETQAALDAHNKEEHIRPLQDPAKYAQENLAGLLGLDPAGKVTEKPAPASDAAIKNGQGLVNMGGQAASKAAVPGAKPTTQNAEGGMAAVDSQPSQTFLDPWEGATIDPHDLLQSFGNFESGAGGAISDMNVYRSLTTPNDTPESSNHVSEPTSDISDGVALDISLDIFDDNWQSFGPGVGGFAVEDLAPADEEDLKMFDDLPPNYGTWDDLVDPSQLDKAFEFDTSLFLMDA